METAAEDNLHQKGSSKAYLLLIIPMFIGLATVYYVGYLMGVRSSYEDENKPEITRNEYEDKVPIDEDTKPVAMATEISTPIPTAVSPTPTAKPTAVIDEAKLIRKLVADFEMYIGVRNTADALKNFTEPVTDIDKAKLAKIRSINVPFGLKSWTYTQNDDKMLLADVTDYRYKIKINENRDGVMTEVIIEVVRQEDKFLIDRYYELSEKQSSSSLKYQGFRL